MSPGGFLCPQRPLLHTAATALLYMSARIHMLLIWGKKIMKNSFTFSLLGNIAELLSLLTLSLWNMISFSAKEKPQQPVTWRQNGSVEFSQEKHGGQVRRVKSFEVFWTVKVSHKDTRWSWIKKEWRKRRSDSPCLIAGWSPQLILDPLSQFHHCNHDQRHTRGEQPRCEAGCTFKCVLSHNPCYVKDVHSLDSFGDVIPHHLRYMDSSQEIHFWWATAVMQHWNVAHCVCLFILSHKEINDCDCN